MEQGREASGRHGKRRASQGLERVASAAITVEGGKNPEDGTGGGVATLTFRDGLGRCGDRGTRRRCVHGGKNLTRGGPDHEVCRRGFTRNGAPSVRADHDAIEL
jgi:hypothetical protein